MTDVDPRTAKHLISDQGEVVIDEVRKHWMAMTGPLLELAGGAIVALLFIGVPKAWWLPVIVGFGIIGHAVWRILDRRRDHFVITNMRVFRIHGILTEEIATMPLSRILDITVHKPFVGRIFGFGHFVFESAAQAQGLREIRYVGHPNERGLTIQRVIQQAGLRGRAGQQSASEQWMPEPEPRSAYRTPAPASRGWDTEILPIAGSGPQDAGVDARRAPFDPDQTTTDPLDIIR
jgi:hypothetical protein